MNYPHSQLEVAFAAPGDVARSKNELQTRLLLSRPDRKRSYYPKNTSEHEYLPLDPPAHHSHVPDYASRADQYG